MYLYYCFKSDLIWSQCPEKVALDKRRKDNPAVPSDSNNQSAILSTAVSNPVTAKVPPLEIVMLFDDVSMDTSSVSERSQVDIPVSILRL